MALETQKFGEALAKAMDRLARMDGDGELEGYSLGEVLVVAVLTRPDTNEGAEFDAVESLVFVDGTTQLPYVQLGILKMAEPVALGISEIGE